MQTCYEIMGLTWRAQSPKQQDALLIGNEVFQQELGISALHQFHADESWCAAVADGVSASNCAEQAATNVLANVQKQWAALRQDRLNFPLIQQQLCEKLANNPSTFGASTTLALVYKTQESQLLKIKHLGDSRIYVYRAGGQNWHCLTSDHTQMEELRRNGELVQGQQYASFYDALTGYFCADSLHEVANEPAQEITLSSHDALLICTDGVHDVLACTQWPNFAPNHDHKSWLTSMKKLLTQHQAYDNVTMVLIRLSNER